MKNDNQQSFLMCMGTRPEIIKMAPIYHEMKRRGIPVFLLHTGQHTDLALPMYEFFGITPDISLDLNRQQNTLEHLSAILIESIGKIIADIKPRAVLVHGDTSTALMAALAAFYNKVPVCHVEAGLRSHHEYDPFPEEKNRELIARLTTWHFSPTAQARSNLQQEGIAAERIYVVGNTAVDTVAIGLEQLRTSQKDKVRLPFDEHVLAGRRLILVTAHRRENWNGPLISIAESVLQIAKDNPDLVVVWPVHANPVVQNMIFPVFADLPQEINSRIHIIEPMNYPEMLKLLSCAWLVLTDSGGIQEEAVSLHIPILVLRDTTERPELIEVGAGKLVGTTRERILENFNNLYHYPDQYEKMKQSTNPFGDGTTAQQIVDVLAGS